MTHLSFDNKWVISKGNEVVFATLSDKESIAIKRFEKLKEISWADGKRKGYAAFNVDARFYNRNNVECVMAEAAPLRRVNAFIGPAINVGRGRSRQKLEDDTPKWHLDIIDKNQKSERSKNEVEIAKFLSKNGVKYIQEYIVQHRHQNRYNIYFFDFHLPEFNAMIEFDGIHHFVNTNGSDLEKQQHQDLLKNNWCKERGLSLLRIKCYDYERFPAIICEFLDRIKPIT